MAHWFIEWLVGYLAGWLVGCLAVKRFKNNAKRFKHNAKRFKHNAKIFKHNAKRSKHNAKRFKLNAKGERTGLHCTMTCQNTKQENKTVKKGDKLKQIKTGYNHNVTLVLKIHEDIVTYILLI